MLDVDHSLRCVATSKADELVSKRVGPVAMNPIIVRTARAIVNRGKFNFKGKAPQGTGQWDIEFGAELVFRLRAGKEQKLKWSDATCQFVKGTRDQLEFVTKQTGKFFMIPAFGERTPTEIPKQQTRDFLAYLFAEFQKTFTQAPKQITRK
jgi:hypothetical protein